MIEGMLPRETNEEYHKRPELSSSDIKVMLDSPLHFKRLVIEKSTLKRESTEAFDLGTCAHECFLEQSTENFAALNQKLDLRRNEDKAKYKEFCELNLGKRIITLEQHEKVKGMFDVIASNPLASQLVSRQGVMIEQGFTYTDPETGLACKYRPDIMMVYDSQIEIDDYKTAESAAPHEFSKSVARYHYHLSAAHYIVGAQVVLKKPVTSYRFIVQEKSEPYAVAIYEMTATDIEKSIQLRSQIMKKIKEHLTTNEWPDWSNRVLPLTIPGYGFSFSEVM